MNNQSDSMASCVFCEIVRGDRPCTLIEKWDSTICIIPLNPCAPGHVLYIPRRHVQYGEENSRVTMETIRCAMEHPQKNMIAAIEKEQQPLPKKSNGTPDLEFDYNTQFSRGPNATQTVFHLHVHLIPRFKADKLPIMWTGQPQGHYNTRGYPKNTAKCKKKCSLCKKNLVVSWQRHFASVELRSS
jgi:histidine triad (HIT) family protein